MTRLERFLIEIIEGSLGSVAAYKLNLAFFESLGPDGWSLLFRMRERLPADSYVIADAKRGDIGTSAAHYARALFDGLGADAITVNPLMGRDAIEPFLRYSDQLTLVLALTSNPCADDFLLPDGLYRKIARKCVDWNEVGNIGLVVGATRSQQMSEIRAIGPDLPWLVPGVGAQGGSLEDACLAGAQAGSWPGLLIHLTRALLPSPGAESDLASHVRDSISMWNARITTTLATPGAQKAGSQ